MFSLPPTPFVLGAVNIKEKTEEIPATPEILPNDAELQLTKETSKKTVAERIGIPN